MLQELRLRLAWPGVPSPSWPHRPPQEGHASCDCLAVIHVITHTLARCAACNAERVLSPRAHQLELLGWLQELRLRLEGRSPPQLAPVPTLLCPDLKSLDLDCGCAPPKSFAVKALQCRGFGCSIVSL